jgi:hypothetical protein
MLISSYLLVIFLVGFSHNGISAMLCEIIAPQNQGLNSSLIQECCLAIRALCIHDDSRKEMSCAFDNGKQLISLGCIPSLLHHANNFANQPDLAAAALYAVRQLVVSEEAVKTVAANGGMSLPAAVYRYPQSTLALIRSVTGLMRNLCADDIRKSALVNDGTLQLLICRLAENDKFMDHVFCEHAYACFAAMSLRSPSNAAVIVECGAIHEMIAGMRRHSNRANLLRQGCLTIRNIAARCPQYRTKLLDEGVEGVLRSCGRYRDVVDEAYGALRDLECEVSVVRVNADGTAEAAYEHFGSGPMGGGQTKPKFNPTFEESWDINQRVANEARAPFSIKEEEDEYDSEGEHGHVHDSNCNH